jgi:hypothetical protein
MRVEYEVSRNIFANVGLSLIISVLQVAKCSVGYQTNPNTFDPTSFDLTAYPKAFTHITGLIRGGGMSNIDFVYHAVRPFIPTSA